MATGYVDPNGDIAKGWDHPASGAHYTKVDDGIRQPTQPGTATKIACDESDGAVDTFAMETIPDVAEVTQVKVWVNGKHAGGGSDASVNIYIGGWKTAGDLGFTGSQSWKSRIFNGSWTQAQLDGLRVKLTSSVEEEGEITVYEVYAEITYEEEAGGEARTATLNPLGLRRFGGF